MSDTSKELASNLSSEVSLLADIDDLMSHPMGRANAFVVRELD